MVSIMVEVAEVAEVAGLAARSGRLHQIMRTAAVVGKLHPSFSARVPWLTSTVAPENVEAPRGLTRGEDRNGAKHSRSPLYHTTCLPDYTRALFFVLTSWYDRRRFSCTWCYVMYRRHEMCASLSCRTTSTYVLVRVASAAL